MDITMIGKLYELNGVIKSLVDVTEIDDTLNHPLIERIDSKMNQIIDELEQNENKHVLSDAANL